MTEDLFVDMDERRRHKAPSLSSRGRNHTHPRKNLPASRGGRPAVCGTAALGRAGVFAGMRMTHLGNRPAGHGVMFYYTLI